jgi:hypothetical protein
MKTKEEIIRIIQSVDLELLESLNESDLKTKYNLTENELSYISGDDLESYEDNIKYIRLNRLFILKQTDYCEKNMKRDLDL